MTVHSLYDPKIAVNHLTQESLALVRLCKEAQTMKGYLYCHDILVLTDRINAPWEKHPGEMLADRAAMDDLYVLAGKLMLYADPSREMTLKYVTDVKRLILFWMMQQSRAGRE